jgi:hypothetical protein
MDWREASLGGYVLPGWVPLVDELHARVLKLDPDIHVAQVKEKFGGLRYYYDTSEKYQKKHGGCRAFTDPMFLLVHAYENISVTTCEVCGERGKQREGGWIHTLCDAHDEARKTKDLHEVIEDHESSASS